MSKKVSRQAHNMRSIIERGASWTLDETKLLLLLWGQDMIQRSATKAKRSKETYDKMSDKFAEAGYDRTTDQVRTRIFNMIAEHRRLMRNPDPERLKKCHFFDPLSKIYSANTVEEVKAALDDYNPTVEIDYVFSPTSFNGDDDSIDTIPSKKINLNADDTSDGQAGSKSIKESNSLQHKHSHSSSKETSDADIGFSSPSAPNKKHRSDTSEGPNPPSTNSLKVPATSLNNITSISGIKQQSLLLTNQTPSTSSQQQSTPVSSKKISASSNSARSSNTPSFINLNNTKLPIFRANQLIGHTNNTVNNETTNGSATTTTRLPTTAIASHQLYQAPVTTFDVTSSALLIDRMFAHLTRESDNMREWIALEKERLSLERARRQQENERELRREKALVETLTKFQEQWLQFLRHGNQSNVNSNNVNLTNDESNLLKKGLEINEAGDSSNVEQQI